MSREKDGYNSPCAVKEGSFQSGKTDGKMDWARIAVHAREGMTIGPSNGKTVKIRMEL